MRKFVVLTILAISIIYFAVTYNSNVVTKAPENSSEFVVTKAKESKLLSNGEFLKRIKKESEVKDAVITEVKVLYVSVIDDGTKRDGLAEYFCGLVKESAVNVDRVKIVKARSNYDSNPSGYGVVLGQCWCK
jgi:hypothetical protein